MFKLPDKKQKSTTQTSNTTQGIKINVGIPYIRGTSERLHRTFRSHGVNMYHKSVNSLPSQLAHVKDTTDDDSICGVSSITSSVNSAIKPTSEKQPDLLVFESKNI